MVHKKKQTKAQSRAANSGRKARKRKKRRRRQQQPSEIRAYAAMIADPCNASMVPGFYSTKEGILSKNKTSYKCDGGSTQKYGYIVWDPERNNFVNAAGVATLNCVIYAPTAATDRPANLSSANNMFGGGSCTVAGQSTSLQVGATAFINTATVSTYRTVGACMRVTYTGKLADLEGRLGWVNGISSDTVLYGGVDAGTPDKPVTPAEMLAMCGRTARFSLETQESKFRPSRTSPNLRAEADNGVWNSGLAVETSASADSARHGSTVIGFAWDGILTSQLLFEFIQIIEWVPDLAAGQIVQPPKQVKEEGYYQHVLKFMDDKMPGWRTSAWSAAGAAANFAANTVAGSYGVNLPHINYGGGAHRLMDLREEKY